MSDLKALANLQLAPYILKATALIGVRRKVGGNQFRHAFSTLGILLDYKYFDHSILLKASLIHDLFEDYPEIEVDEIMSIEEESPRVVELVLEVTRRQTETKKEYLQRLVDNGSWDAWILKCADRISNLTDLHRDTHTEQKIADYLLQTEQYVVPMAQKVNADMVTELEDLIATRRKILPITGQE